MKLVGYKQVGTRSEAMKFEASLKNLKSRALVLKRILETN